MIFRNLNLDRATARARDRGRYAGSRASRSGVLHSALRVPLAPPDVLRALSGGLMDHWDQVRPLRAAIWFKSLRISRTLNLVLRRGVFITPCTHIKRRGENYSVSRFGGPCEHTCLQLTARRCAEERPTVNDAQGRITCRVVGRP